MTDEEKWEEYIRENVCNKERVCGSQSVCSDKAIKECNEYGNFCYFARINKKSYIDGLAEGRKEVREHETTCVNRLHHVEKENAELKAQVEQLSNDNYVLKTSFITQREQIEKMKCCGNCIHFMYGYCMTDKSCHINNEYKEWELAE